MPATCGIVLYLPTANPACLPCNSPSSPRHTGHVSRIRATPLAHTYPSSHVCYMRHCTYTSFPSTKKNCTAISTTHRTHVPLRLPCRLALSGRQAPFPLLPCHRKSPAHTMQALTAADRSHLRALLTPFLTAHDIAPHTVRMLAQGYLAPQHRVLLEFHLDFLHAHMVAVTWANPVMLAPGPVPGWLPQQPVVEIVFCERVSFNAGEGPRRRLVGVPRTDTMLCIHWPASAPRTGTAITFLSVAMDPPRSATRPPHILICSAPALEPDVGSDSSSSTLDLP